MKFVYAKGATPYNKDDALSLIPQHITTQQQLNEWEQYNILKAERWLFNQRNKNILFLENLIKLHFKMFNETWKWAGKYRQYQTNIGIPFFHIPIHLKSLCEDVHFWIERNTFSYDEIAVRFHHRLVYIHAFPNGNGRHGRLAADALLMKLKGKRFNWGQGSLTPASDLRNTYIRALQKADGDMYEDLISFSLS